MCPARKKNGKVELTATQSPLFTLYNMRKPPMDGKSLNRYVDNIYIYLAGCFAFTMIKTTESLATKSFANLSEKSRYSICNQVQI